MLLLMMMMMSRFCIVCFFLIILPAYVILGSLNTVSTMVELCNNRSINAGLKRLLPPSIVGETLNQ